VTAQGYGAVDKVSRSGDTMTGPLTLEGSPPLAVPGGASGEVLTSDGSGNLTLQTPAASAVTIDTTATDIQALGTQAAGSTGKAADAGHVHPITGLLARGAEINGVTDWFSVKDPAYAGGAKGDRSTDDTAAIQAAINAAHTAGGGVVYFPAGLYRTTSALTWSATPNAMIRFTGDHGGGEYTSPTATALCPNFVGDVVSITGGGYNAAGFFQMDHLDIYADGTNSASPYYSVQYSALHLANLANFLVVNCNVGSQGNGNHGTNVGIQSSMCGAGTVRDCYVSGERYGFWMQNGTGQILNETVLGSVAGNGGSAVCMDGSRNGTNSGAGTLSLTNVTTFRGDRGLWLTGSSGHVPAFVNGTNFQINNPSVAAMQFDWGHEVWLNQVWASDSAGWLSPAAAVRYGINAGPNFSGVMAITNSQFQDFSGHGIWVQGGSGYAFTNVTFGGNGQYASNSYDDLHIGSSVSSVTVTGCHFETDVYYTLGSTKARSGLYIESGASGYDYTGNIFGSGYGTRPILDSGSGWHTVTLDSGWSTVSGYAPLRYRMLADNQLQIDGCLNHTSITGTTNVNGSNPLPAAYQPAYQAFGTAGGNRSPWQITTRGVIQAVPGGTSCNYLEIHATIPLT